MKSYSKWSALALSFCIAAAASMTSCIEPHFVEGHRGHSDHDGRYQSQHEGQQRYYQKEQQSHGHHDDDEDNGRREYYQQPEYRRSSEPSGPSITIRP